MPSGRRVSSRQIQNMLDWMELHPLQARGSQLGGYQAKQTSHVLWEELASQLNAVGDGATKTTREWRQYWSDLKSRLRRKAAEIAAHGRGTGGGPAYPGILTPTEERILSLLGIQSVLGNANVQVPVDMGLDVGSPSEQIPGPATTDICQPYTSQPCTSQPCTSQPCTSQPYTSQPYTSLPCTSQPCTSQPYASPPCTSQPYASQPCTSQPCTSQPYTSQPCTSQPREPENRSPNPIAASAAPVPVSPRASSSKGRPPKRKHIQVSFPDAGDKSRVQTGAPRWALELEERRIREEEMRRKLEERRLQVEEQRLELEREGVVLLRRLVGLIERLVGREDDESDL